MKKILYASCIGLIGVVSLAVNSNAADKKNNDAVDTLPNSNGGMQFTNNHINDNNRFDDKFILGKSVGKVVNNKFYINKSVDGFFTIKANIGYIYHFPTKWNMDGVKVNGAGNSAVGYGASVGYTHRLGFGLSADYLGFNNKWNSDGTGYDASFHTLLFTPSYRFALDKESTWGLRLGLGVGFSLSDVAWGKTGGAAGGLSGVGASGKSADGAIYSRYDNRHVNSAFMMPLCANKLAGSIHDQVGVGIREMGNQCYAPVPHGSSKIPDRVAQISDTGIARWFMADSGARLGDYFAPNGTGDVSYGVWSLLLRAADGNTAALLTLNPGIIQQGSGAIVPTQLAARSALIRLVNGYDGRTPPAGYQPHDDDGTSGNTIYITNNRAALLGINPVEAERLRQVGVAFKDGAKPTPSTPVITPQGEVGPLPTPSPEPRPERTSGKAKDDAGFVLAPQVAIEYDNGHFHGEVNVRYLQAMKSVKYDGTGDLVGKTYSVAAGPAALFIGAGFGVNF